MHGTEPTCIDCPFKDLYIYLYAGHFECISKSFFSYVHNTFHSCLSISFLNMLLEQTETTMSTSMKSNHIAFKHSLSVKLN